MPAVPLTSEDLLMRCVEDYEESRQREELTDFRQFLPNSTHPDFKEVATELIRVDMEYSWAHGNGQTVEDYRKILPAVLSNPQVLEVIAYEEYRLKAQTGQQVNPKYYSRRYSIDTRNWRKFSTEEFRKHETRDSEKLVATIPGVLEEACEYVDLEVDFPRPGDSFLNFRLERELGRGAFARVFLARQEELSDRPVVLKIVSGATLEPQHLARLQHTNIVPVYSVHSENGFTAVCMPYFGQRTLSDVTRTLEHSDQLPNSGQAFLSTIRSPVVDTVKIEAVGKSVSGLKILSASGTEQFGAQEESRSQNYVDCIIQLVLQVAEGLAHAHQRGIVHRDVKPANVLLTDDGVPLILDFNLSTDIVVNGRASLLVGGTLPYMAPEHLNAVANGGKVGFSADIYSLGVIFYELLTGKRPFVVPTGTFDEVVEQMIADRKRMTPSARRLNPNVPRSVDAIISRCLAADSLNRYQAASELCDDLRRHLDDLPLCHVPDRYVPERAAKWVRRHPRVSSASWVATLAGAVILACLAVGIHWWAESNYQEFQSSFPLARAALSIPENDPDLIATGMNNVHEVLSEYGVLTGPTWFERIRLYALSPQHRNQLEQEFSELLYQLSEATIRGNDSDAIALAEGLRLNALARNYVKSDQQPQALLLQQARLLERTGDVVQANLIRNVANSREPQGALDLYLKCQQLLLEFEYAKALPLLAELRDSSPTDPVYWLLLGNANSGIARLHDAEGAYSTAAALLPDSYYSFFNRGLCRFDLQKYEESLKDFNRVLDLQPGLPTCLLNRARVHAALGNHQAAVADYTKALENGASQTRIYFLRARSLTAQGDVEGAIRDRAEGLRLTPSDADSWGARGMAKLSDDPQSALEDFRKAVALNPLSLQAWMNIVHVTAERLNQPDEAMIALNRILEICPEDPSALAGRAVLSARQGDRPSAIADVQHLLRLTKEPTHLFQAACALSHTSQKNEADLAKGMLLLSKAVIQEPALVGRAQSDPDLENLRAQEDFMQIIQRATYPDSKIMQN